MTSIRHIFLLEIFRHEKLKIIEPIDQDDMRYECYQWQNTVNYLNGGNAYRPFSLVLRVLTAEATAERLDQDRHLADAEMGLFATSRRAAAVNGLDTHQNMRDAFYAACAAGRLKTAKWFKVYYNIALSLVRSHNNLALRLACAGGHLLLARWLADTFRLTSQDASARDNFALRAASTRGHAATAVWIVLRFKLSAEAIPHHTSIARCAFRAGRATGKNLIQFSNDVRNVFESCYAEEATANDQSDDDEYHIGDILECELRDAFEKLQRPEKELSRMMRKIRM